MLGAKKILINIKGSNTDFVKSIAGANLAMKGFAATTVASNSVVMASAGTMAGGVVASMGIASAGMGATSLYANLTSKELVEAFKRVKTGSVAAAAGVDISAKKMALSMKLALGVVGVAIIALAAYLLSLKKAVKGAVEDQVVIAQTTALLEQQGLAWSDLGGDITKYIEDLERLTTFGDTELQETFNTFLALGMDTEGALEAMSAAAALANGSNLSLASATKMLSNEQSTETSRLKQLNLNGESWEETLQNITDTMGDGSHVTTTLSGKWKVLGNEIMNALKPSGEALIPILMDIMDIMIWGVKHVISPLINKIKGLISAFTWLQNTLKYTALTAKATWQALTGDIEGLNETLNLIDNINNKVKGRLELEFEVTEEIEVQTAAIDEQTSSLSKLDAAWLAAGGWISGAGEYVSASEMGISGAGEGIGEDTVTETLKTTEEIAREESKKTDTVISLLQEIRDKDWSVTVSGGGGGGFGYSPEDRSSGVI